MVRPAILFLAFLMSAACASPPAPAPQPPPPATIPTIPLPPQPIIISVVGTSDLHGHLDKTPLLGGFLDNLRAVRNNDGGIVLVDAGDMFQGTIAANETEGAAVIRAYNALGYHAAVIGNHEFDYGPVGPAAIPASPTDDPRGALIAAAKQANFALLAANYLDKATDQPVHWPPITPSTIIEVAGIKVGIVGVSTANTLETTIASNVHDLRMAPLADTIQEQAKGLRTQGANVVIAVAHAGGNCSSFDNPDDISSCKQSEIFDVAEAIEPSLVDVLIGGHTHRAVAHRVNGIPIIQSYAYGSAFGRVDLHVDPSTGEVVVLRIHPPQSTCQDRKGPCVPGSYEGAPVEPNENVLRAVKEDLERAREKQQQPVGVTLQAELSSRGVPSSPLGDRVAAWMLEVRPAAQVVFVNSGGIRASLPQGPLSYGAFFEMFPFDNRFASAKVKVAALRTLVRDNLTDGVGFSVAGIQVRASCKGEDLQVELLRGGRALRDTEDIVVLMSDYLAMTSKVARAGMSKEAFSLEDDPPIREVLIEHLRKKGGTIPTPGSSPMNAPDRWPVTCPSS